MHVPDHIMAGPSRRTLLAIPLLICALVVALGWSVLTAEAATETASVKTASGSEHYGDGRISASLQGVTSTVRARACDTKSDGHGIYIEATINLAFGPDPDKTVVKAGPAGTCDSGTWTHTSSFGIPQKVKYKLCRSDAGLDTCKKGDVSYN
jgi:hypothetical protein